MAHPRRFDIGLWSYRNPAKGRIGHVQAINSGACVRINYSIPWTTTASPCERQPAVLESFFQADNKYFLGTVTRDQSDRPACRLRFSRAIPYRCIMARLGCSNAAGAAFKGGYESTSQFNREYRLLFGHPPMRDIKTRQLVEVEQNGERLAG